METCHFLQNILMFPFLEFYISKMSENKKPTHNKKSWNAISSIYFDTEAQHGQIYNIRWQKQSLLWQSNEKHISFRLQGKHLLQKERTIYRLCPTDALSREPAHRHAEWKPQGLNKAEITLLHQTELYTHKQMHIADLLIRSKW